MSFGFASRAKSQLKTRLNILCETKNALWLGGLLLCAIALWLWGTPAVVAQQPTGAGVIEARAVLATSGSSASLANLPASLFTFVNGVRQGPPQATQTDAQGMVRFAGLQTSSNFSYTVFIKFQDFLYDSAPITFSAGNSKADVSVRVFDAPVSITQRHGFIMVDPEGQSLFVTESFSFVNKADRALSGGPDPAAQNKRVSFRATLPPSLIDVSVEDRQPNAETFIAGNQLLDTIPIAPGQTYSFTYSYRLPFSRSTLKLELFAPYNTTTLTLFAAAPITIQGAGLSPQGTLKIGQREMRQFGANNLAAGSTLSVELNDLPAPLIPIEVLQWAPLVVVSLTLLGAFVWLNRRQHGLKRT